MSRKQISVQENLPSEREISKRQALENAAAARDTRRSHKPGVDDDSEVIQTTVETLAAPIEGAHNALREGEQSRILRKSRASGNDVTSSRLTEVVNVTSTHKKRQTAPK